ncbi:MAG: SPOR domain-containing protein [Hahellaceae bacterium]|nr:SPOR domain-containing protein [Hahellaceae bacterium]
MDIKQRVVGAIVLVALAIIFIPMVLEKPHQDSRHQVLSIPPGPEVAPFKIERATPPTLNRSQSAPPPPTLEAPSSPAGAPSGEAPASPAPSAVPGYRVIEKDGEASQRVAPSIVERPPVRAEPVQAEPVNVVPAKVPETAPKPAPKPLSEPKAAPITSGWTIQIGTFKNRASAMAIRDELLADKTGGYVQDFRSSDGQTLTRVFAGPFLQREQADKVKSGIDKRYKVSSLVVQYQPSR